MVSGTTRPFAPCQPAPSSCPVEDQDGIGTGGNSAGDPGQIGVQRLRVGAGQDEARRHRTCGADRPGQAGRDMTGIADRPGPGASPRPDAGERALLADPCVRHGPRTDGGTMAHSCNQISSGLSRARAGTSRRYRRGEVFLNAACAPGSGFGCGGHDLQPPETQCRQLLGRRGTRAGRRRTRPRDGAAGHGVANAPPGPAPDRDRPQPRPQARPAGRVPTAGAAAAPSGSPARFASPARPSALERCTRSPGKPSTGRFPVPPHRSVWRSIPQVSAADLRGGPLQHQRDRQHPPLIVPFRSLFARRPRVFRLARCRAQLRRCQFPPRDRDPCHASLLIMRRH